MSIRMRAQDGTLGRTVFWNSGHIDDAGEGYSGPGPLTDIVVFKVDLDDGGMSVGTTDLQTATFTAEPGQMYLLGAQGKGAEILLPSAATVGNRAIVAFKLLANTAGWGVFADGSDTIDGQSEWVIYPIGSCMLLISDGVSNWEIISNSRSIAVRSDGADIATPSAFSVFNFLPPFIVVDSGNGQATVSYGAPGRVFASVSGGFVGATNGLINTFSSSAPTSIILGPAADTYRTVVTIKSDNTSSSSLTVLPAFGDTIDGAASYDLPTANKSVTMVADGGTNWEVIGAT
jgi:hypothetical protein